MAFLVLCTLLVLGLSSNSAQVLSTSQLQGTWNSYRCENIDYNTGVDVSWITRQATFSANTYTLNTVYYSALGCQTPIAYLNISGTYSLQGIALDGVNTNANFVQTVKTLTVLNPGTQFFYQNQSCWNLQFPIGQAVDISQANCPALLLNSCQSTGELDILGIVNGGFLFFGSRVTPNSFCVLPRPTELGNNGLVQPNFDYSTLRLPNQVSQQATLNPLMAQISTSNIQTFLTQLSTGFLNRYFNSTGGLAAADFVYQQFQVAAGNCSQCTVTRFHNNNTEPGFNQDTIIAQYPGRLSSAGSIILSAHFDSCAFINPATNTSEFYRTPGDNWPYNFINRPAPGAVDNGSGVAALLEAFRVLAQSGLQTQRSIQFIAFAGEEQGLLLGQITGTAGSGVLSLQYRKSNTLIAALLNLDAVGNPFIAAQNGNLPNPLGAVDNSIGIFSSASCDPQIWNLTAAVTAAYTNQQPLVRQTAGASDFRSFIWQGYPAGGVVESNIFVDGLLSCFPGSPLCNPFAQHTIYDTVARVDFNYLTQFARLVLGFAYEASFVPGVPLAPPSGGLSRTVLIIIILAVVLSVLLTIGLIVFCVVKRRSSSSSGYDYTAYPAN